MKKVFPNLLLVGATTCLTGGQAGTNKGLGLKLRNAKLKPERDEFTRVEQDDLQNFLGLE